MIRYFRWVRHLVRGGDGTNDDGDGTNGGVGGGFRVCRFPVDIRWINGDDPQIPIKDRRTPIHSSVLPPSYHPHHHHHHPPRSC